MRYFLVLCGFLMVTSAGAETTYAHVINGEVVSVIVAEPEYIATLPDSSSWIRTWPTRENRKNYAGIGFIYDATSDAFISPKPFKSWKLDRTTFSWQPPQKEPADGRPHTWDETTRRWQPLVANSVTPTLVNRLTSE